MKKKIRKLLLRKYAVILLLSVLSLGYLYLGDWLFGYGLGNIAFILDYLLYTLSEKLVASLMLLALFLPDLIYWFTGNYPERGAER
ncbi:hypothetical protein GCM10010912_33080 [Paenibacillus albidus]|uniref:Uncharacterized protein n=1 Tax=Paenibacillus albidus TaxID=2041023 RepID=A0A917FJU3_9BACL|nr:hypothetical protein [Paenibacillus albidus]GGF85155.1 hypothetical protein GCM10010912_33080 [Paenibacillus albidus]